MNAGKNFCISENQRVMRFFPRRTFSCCFPFNFFSTVACCMFPHTQRVRGFFSADACRKSPQLLLQSENGAAANKCVCSKQFEWKGFASLVFAFLPWQLCFVYICTTHNPLYLLPISKCFLSFWGKKETITTNHWWKCCVRLLSSWIIFLEAWK